MDVAIKVRDFESKILFFNGMYKLPVAPYPTTKFVIEHEAKRAPIVPVASLSGKAMRQPTGKDYLQRRLFDFKKILTDEIEEIEHIRQQLDCGFVVDKDGNITDVPYTELKFLTDMADWLTDLQVYQASEMAKYGIPVKESQNIVMSSNFSKLGADGKPIYDGNGKVQKGPMYWKPEPQLEAMLGQHIQENGPIPRRGEEDGIVWREPAR